jgi:SpoVK/Ycf46/Vps4 family AAA+-type ATPase
LDYAARVKTWEQAARAVSLTLAPADSQALASALRFDPAQIRATMALCRGTMPATAVTVARGDVQTKAREVARFDAPALVRRLGAHFTWDDLVLPAPILAQLREIPSHVRRAGEVIERWGYAARLPYGQGVAALFSGPSGTGKTMAAQIIARELGVEIFQLDLAKTVSKYIGETEKNLDRIFESAERASALLLIDEADAVFGKRTEIKDAHDRYANVEVAYLLQRMEAYCGLAILTTNLKQNIDGSFLRRLRFVVELPPPGGKERLAIWQRAFPRSAPLDPALDLTFLAQRFPLTGGHIQQIALLAAFAAAEEGAATGAGRISMHHVVQATRQQLAKLGMTTAEQSLSETAA